MTHDERISSYIDNELSVEQEQEFLISLAASEGLRKSFRSELVLKKVLHHDEAATNPPRRLRAAVFTTLGLGGAGASSTMLGAHNANAAEPVVARSLVKSLFATKMSTLATVIGISASALAGYGVRSITAPTHVVAPRIEHVVNHAKMVPTPAMTSPASVPSVVSDYPAAVVSNEQSSANTPRVSHHAVTAKHQSVVASKNENVSGASGTGSIKIEPPKINGQH
jgi:negative regulator of sigma E activity